MIEKKLTFGVEDIEAIRVTCNRCKETISWNLDASPKEVGFNCPKCSTPWNGDLFDEWSAMGCLTKILQGIHGFCLKNKDNESVTVRIETDAP